MAELLWQPNMLQYMRHAQAQTVGDGIAVIKETLASIPAALLVFLSASSPESDFEVMPELKTVEVACTSVSSLPAFTQGTCAQLAENVEQGLEEFSELTGGAVESPQVRHRLLPGTVHIDDAREIRCINYNDATPAQVGRITAMVHKTTNTALEQVRIDLDETGLVVAVNATPDLCRKEPPVNLTERCPDTESKKAYLGGRALHHAMKGPVVFIFASPGQPELELSLTRHERGHLGIRATRLGHDLALCNNDGDQLPSRIEREDAGLSVDIRARKASIMGYSAYAPDLYIAPPHLVHLGLIDGDRIITPKRSGEVTLGDIHQTGPAVLQLELVNSAIKKAIAPEVSKVGLSVDDYLLCIGKISGIAEAGIYATPTPDKLRNNEHSPIFLLKRIGVGEEIDIVDGPKVKTIGGNKNAVTIDLQLAESSSVGWTR
jgi:hypothetical protein